MSRRIDKMKQVIKPSIFVYHVACLGFDRNATFPLDIEFVEDLLVVARFDGSRKLQESIAKGALAMVDVCDNAEVPISLQGYGCDAMLELGERLRRWAIAEMGRRKCPSRISKACERRRRRLEN